MRWRLKKLHLSFFAQNSRKEKEIGINRSIQGIKDEDKWFRYFTKKQALVMILVLLADYKLIMAAAPHGMVIAAIIVSILMTLVAGGMVMIELPVDVMFLTGGGITLDQWLFRVILRKSRKVIYTKHTQEGS